MNHTWKPLVGATLVALLLALPTTAFAAKAQVVGTDPKNDWGSNHDAALAPIGNALGMELVSASIGMKNSKTINFILKLNSLPPIGGTPEIARYSWDFTVNGKQFELDGKFTNFSRGICDPTAGSCPPPRNPGLQPFFLRGKCTQVENVVTCKELALLQATFNTGKATITIPVPTKLLKAKPGARITGAGGTFGGTISAAPAAFLTYGDFPMDLLMTTKTFRVPR